MANYEYNLGADHFEEDDLSYMYDLDGDHNDISTSHDHGNSSSTRQRAITGRRTTPIDEEIGEMKALLMTVINDNRGYEEKIRRLEEQEKRNREHYKEKIKRLEEDYFSQKTTNSSNLHSKSYRTLQTKDMKSLDEENEEDTSENSDTEDDTRRTVNSKFSEDTFSLMMISPFFSWGYFLGIFTFLFQIGLTFLYNTGFIFYLTMVLDKEYYADNEEDTYYYEQGLFPFHIPFDVDFNVRFGQYSVAILSILLQADIQIAIQYLFLFRKNTENRKVLLQNQTRTVAPRNKFFEMIMIFRAIYFPNTLRFIQGCVVTMMLVILIIQSDDFIELLMNFTALFIISQIDDIIFKFVRRGYCFGFRLAENAAKVESMTLVEERRDGMYCFCTSYFVRSLFLGTLSVGIIASVVVVGRLQSSGYIFKARYPDCDVHGWWIHEFYVQKGSCNAEYNTEECGWDAGDCEIWNKLLWIQYPECKNDVLDLHLWNALDPRKIGDGSCNAQYNVEECGWDGGDCIDFNSNYPNCNVTYPNLIGNEECDNYGEYNTEECQRDGGDCIEFNAQYPNCTAYYPIEIGNGRCYKFAPYYTEECGWDGGDCN